MVYICLNSSPLFVHYNIRLLFGSGWLWYFRGGILDEGNAWKIQKPSGHLISSKHLFQCEYMDMGWEKKCPWDWAVLVFQGLRTCGPITATVWIVIVLLATASKENWCKPFLHHADHTANISQLGPGQTSIQHSSNMMGPANRGSYWIWKVLSKAEHGKS